MAIDPQDEQIVARLRQATLQLSRRMRHESGSIAALTPSRTSALSSIESHGPIRMTDLAKMERISKSSITRIIATLSEMGLVELVPDPNDGRSTLVGATIEGKQVLASASERTDAFLAHNLASFSEAERAMVEVSVLLLERLAKRSRHREPRS